MYVFPFDRDQKNRVPNNGTFERKKSTKKNEQKEVVFLREKRCLRWSNRFFLLYLLPNPTYIPDQKEYMGSGHRSIYINLPLIIGLPASTPAAQS